MDRTNKLFVAYCIFAVIFIGGWCVTFYYPNHTETIIVEKVVSSNNKWMLVTTEGIPYEISFNNYAIIDIGKTYTGVVTSPFLSETESIDHLVEVVTP